MWMSESSKRREKNISDVSRLERQYNAYLDRLKTPNGRVPQPVRIGELLKKALKEAKRKLMNEKRRKQQELTTKDFFSKYKIPHGMQWVAELEVTPDWETPEVKNGTTTTPEGILSIATKYYKWLFSEKTSDDVPANQMLGTLSGDNPLRKMHSDICEGEITTQEVFDTMKNLPREKALGPDGIPNEFYKTFAKMIAPELAAVYNEAHKRGRLSKLTKKAP